MSCATPTIASCCNPTQRTRRTSRPGTGAGFRQTETHRLYGDAALQGTIRITVAEPLAHRAAVAREIGLGLGLPLL